MSYSGSRRERSGGRRSFRDRQSHARALEARSFLFLRDLLGRGGNDRIVDQDAGPERFKGFAEGDVGFVGGGLVGVVGFRRIEPDGELDVVAVVDDVAGGLGGEGDAEVGDVRAVAQRREAGEEGFMLLRRQIVAEPEVDDVLEGGGHGGGSVGGVAGGAGR